jgi:hypothetical protein
MENPMKVIFAIILMGIVAQANRANPRNKEEVRLPRWAVASAPASTNAPAWVTLPAARTASHVLTLCSNSCGDAELYDTTRRNRVASP